MVHIILKSDVFVVTCVSLREDKLFVLVLRCFYIRITRAV